MHHNLCSTTLLSSEAHNVKISIFSIVCIVLLVIRLTNLHASVYLFYTTSDGYGVWLMCGSVVAMACGWCDSKRCMCACTKMFN